MTKSKLLLKSTLEYPIDDKIKYKWSYITINNESIRVIRTFFVKRFHSESFSWVRQENIDYLHQTDDEITYDKFFKAYDGEDYKE